MFRCISPGIVQPDSSEKLLNLLLECNDICMTPVVSQ